MWGSQHYTGISNLDYQSQEEKPEEYLPMKISRWGLCPLRRSLLETQVYSILKGHFALKHSPRALIEGGEFKAYGSHEENVWVVWL